MRRILSAALGLLTFALIACNGGVPTTPCPGRLCAIESFTCEDGLLTSATLALYNGTSTDQKISIIEENTGAEPVTTRLTLAPGKHHAQTKKPEGDVGTTLRGINQDKLQIGAVSIGPNMTC